MKNKIDKQITENLLNGLYPKRYADNFLGMLDEIKKPKPRYYDTQPKTREEFLKEHIYAEVMDDRAREMEEL